MRRTKIVSTIGPACGTKADLRRLLAAGTNVVRIALSHGTLREHTERLLLVREVISELGLTVGILADLSGGKLRAAPFVEDAALSSGDVVSFAPAATKSHSNVIGFDHAVRLDNVKLGDHVRIGDGQVLLEVVQIGDGLAAAVVLHGGRLRGSPGVHLPSEQRPASAPDPDELAWVIEQDVDLVAVSFVASAGDVRSVQRAVPNALVVAKIEAREAVEQLDAIVEAADGVMVARGDLGHEFPIEDVPHLQKRIIRTCVARGKPVITATQMLESMIEAPVPTRAEASDVANAVIDGTDALMLSADTAIGRQPDTVVATMARLAARAEQEADSMQWGERMANVRDEEGVEPAITHAAWRAAIDARADAIVCCTNTGATARNMARFRPLALLVAASPHDRVLRQLALSWGVQPMPVGFVASTDELVAEVVGRSLAARLIHDGDTIAVLAGSPKERHPTTDSLRLLRATRDEPDGGT